MPEFFASPFAWAGLAAAAGPVVIHLLNRRRYRVVEWAAMDFLREAVQRNRRILRLRDLLLLLMRTLCVLLFGLAMARPYFSQTAATVDPDQPVHAVLVIDNSLSMGYVRLGKTLLDEAKIRAIEFSERLPQGSRLSVLPLCGSATTFSRDAFRTVEDFRDAVGRIEVVDRSGSASQAIDLAVEACRQVTDLPNKRVVFIGDQQAIDWPAGALASQLKQIKELQIVQVAPEASGSGPLGSGSSGSGQPEENAWISDFRMQDSVADVEIPTIFLATVRYAGRTPRQNVPVSLTVDQAEVASQTVDLEPGQSREVRFTYRFDVPIEAGQAAFVPVSVSMPADNLPGDDRRFLAVPVVAALPVVFVDQYGAREDPRQGRYGETFPLRRLLSPVTSRDEAQRQPVKIRHLTLDQVDRKVLGDARLVVIAGVERPEADLQLLREYVAQGGQLIVTAGGDFDPAAWSSAAWQEGRGILPLPLQTEPVGRVPDETTARLDPFFIAPETMQSDYFNIDQSSREELQDLYRVPVFFKAVVADYSPPTLQKLLEADTQRLTADREFLAASKVRQAEFAEKRARRVLTDAEQQQLSFDEERRNETQPHWLLWGRDDTSEDVSVAKQAEQMQPRILAAFTNKVPFLVERQIGRGQVLFVATGVQGGWNNLAATNAVLILDQILRAKLAKTLPERNFETVSQIVVPVESSDRRTEFLLSRPGGTEESLAVDALGGDRFGVTIRDVTARGLYRVTARRLPAATASTTTTEPRTADVTLAVNGPEAESHLESMTEKTLHERLGDPQDTSYRWVAPGQQISLEGAQISGHEMWKWLLMAVMALLFAELALLAWPEIKKEQPV